MELIRSARQTFLVAVASLTILAASCSRSENVGSAAPTDSAAEFKRPAAVADGVVLAKSNFEGETTLDEVAAEFETLAPEPEFNTETYDAIVENEFLPALENPLSTFSIDVDTASYANMRRMLRNGSLPPAGAVRLEEFVNYFSYNDPEPTDDHPFAVHTELADCPWKPSHLIARIALKGREIEIEERPSSNLVFLLDVSGSMRNANKLPLVKAALKLLTEQLDERDRISIVVYAGGSGLALQPTAGNEQEIILEAMDRLRAGGSTNGGQGIQLAYKTAAENFIEDGINRVILCTDGDFNVGTTSQSELISLIEEKAASGVFLSVLGFGQGNYKDSTMEKLADKGNGNYAYIDSRREAEKVLVEQATGTLITIAKDVKIQVDFNPAKVAAYRLLGYENRMLRAEDFKDDTKDAGEIGAGHSVTALYEIVPAGADSDAIRSSVDGSQYVSAPEVTDDANAAELLTVRLRYKQPDGDTSTEFRVPLPAESKPFEMASTDFQFATSVASFGMILRDSKHRGDASLAYVQEIAESALGDDVKGYRAEFVKLVGQASDLMKTGETKIGMR